MSDSQFDADATRRVLAAVVERLDEVAAALLGGSPTGSEERGREEGVPLFASAADSSEDSGPVSSPMNLLIVEGLELLSKLLGSLIALLESLSRALDDILAVRRPTAGPRPSGSAYQPIEVDIATGPGAR